MKTAEQIVRDYVPDCEQEEKDRSQILHYFSVCNDLLTRKNTLFHFTASAWVMNPRRTKALMVHHNIYNAWSWVGGHADGCGDLFEVACRELAEETGLTSVRALSEDPVSLEIIGVQSHWRKGEYVAPHIHLNVTYLFEAEENAPLRVKEDENSGVMWRDTAAIRKDDTEPHMQKLYCKIMDKLKV